MKTINKYAIVCIAMMIFSGCDDFLTEKPATSLFDTHIYANDETAFGGLVACYRQFAGGGYYGTNFPTHVQANSVFAATRINLPGYATIGADMREIVDAARFQITNVNSSLASMWSGVYSALVTINNFIYAVENAGGISEAAKLKYIGEARFLRAVCNFDIVRLWGEAPLKIAPLQSIEDGNLPKSPVNDFFTAILDDLEYAEANMPTKAEQPAGRPFNYAATALKAKVYAQMATSQDMFTHNAAQSYPDPYTSADRAEFWRQSYLAAKKVYDDKPYELVPRYGDLWQCRSENTVESIFEIQFNADINNNNWMSRLVPEFSTYTPKLATANGADRIRPSKVMYEWHVERYYDRVSYHKDPRIDENYVVNQYLRGPEHGNPYSTVRIYPSDNVQANERYPVLIKYADPECSVINRTNTNWIYYRYADLLLVLAEAANEIDDPDNLKFKVVNEVLARARNSTPVGDPPSEQPADWDPSDARFDTMEGFRMQIFREYLCELPIEGHEWYNIRRRGRAEFKYWAELFNAGVLQYQRPDDIAAGFDWRLFAPTEDNHVRKSMRWPIPYSEIINNSSMTEADQNFGYN